MSNSNIIRLSSFEIELLENFRKHLMESAKTLEKICKDSFSLKADAQKKYEEAQKMTYAELTRQAIYFMDTKLKEQEERWKE